MLHWTYVDRNNREGPEHRSAIVASELVKYNIDIAAVSEVRFSDAGFSQEEAGYTIF